MGNHAPAIQMTGIQRGPQDGAHFISDDMQRHMDNHRATNHSQTINQDQHNADDFNIRDRISDPNLQDIVDKQMGGFREDIPALFNTPTASVSGAPTLQGISAAPAMQGTQALPSNSGGIPATPSSNQITASLQPPPPISQHASGPPKVPVVIVTLQ